MTYSCIHNQSSIWFTLAEIDLSWFCQQFWSPCQIIQNISLKVFQVTTTIIRIKFVERIKLLQPRKINKTKEDCLLFFVQLRVSKSFFSFFNHSMTGHFWSVPCKKISKANTQRMNETKTVTLKKFKLVIFFSLSTKY